MEEMSKFWKTLKNGASSESEEELMEEAANEQQEQEEKLEEEISHEEEFYTLDEEEQKKYLKRNVSSIRQWQIILDMQISNQMHHDSSHFENNAMLSKIHKNELYEKPKYDFGSPKEISNTIKPLEMTMEKKLF